MPCLFNTEVSLDAFELLLFLWFYFTVCYTYPTFCDWCVVCQLLAGGAHIYRKQYLAHMSHNRNKNKRHNTHASASTKFISVCFSSFYQFGIRLCTLVFSVIIIIIIISFFFFFSFHLLMKFECIYASQ